MRKQTLLLSLLFVFLSTVTSAQKENKEHTSAATLFNYQPNVEQSVELQRERLIVASAVRPIVKGEKLVLPEKKASVAPIYYTYTEQLIEILNSFIPELSEINKETLFFCFSEKGVIEDAILGAYLSLDDKGYVLKIDKETALRIGFKEKYFNSKLKSIEQINKSMLKEKNLTSVDKQKKSVLIFCPAFIANLQMEQPELLVKLNKKLQELNKKY